MLKQYEKTSQLEKDLGSMSDESNLFSFNNILSLDEKSVFPEQQADFLYKLGLADYFIPVNLGGKLQSFEEFISLWRSIFRRDATLGLGFGLTTFMAAVSGIYFGSDEIKKQIVKTIKNQKSISVAYHEEDHGNDLLHAEVFGEVTSDAIKLTGKKLVINNAAISGGLTVFCRTSQKAGARAFSLIYVNKENCNNSTLNYHEKISTLGVRGCKISGVEFNQTSAPLNSIISKLGNGLEVTLKAFQITRATLPGMSIGIVDTALRKTFEFANSRVLYGSKILSFTHVYETLVDAYIDISISDCVSLMSARSLHVITEQMSVISALTKFYIPKKLQNTLNDLSVILGARQYVREGHENEYAIFQKLMRDYPVISLAHANDVVCASTIIAQLKYLLWNNSASFQDQSVVKKIFSLDEKLPEFDADKLSISNHGRNSILESLAYLYHLISEINNNKIIDLMNDVCLKVKSSLTKISDSLYELKYKIKYVSLIIKDFDMQAYDCVEKYCQAHVAISCILFWVYNLKKISPWFDEGIWLVLALQKINNNYIDIEKEIQKSFQNKTLINIEYLVKENISFSLVPVKFQ